MDRLSLHPISSSFNCIHRWSGTIIMIQTQYNRCSSYLDTSSGSRSSSSSPPPSWSTPSLDCYRILSGRLLSVSISVTSRHNHIFTLFELFVFESDLVSDVDLLTESLIFYFMLKIKNIINVQRLKRGTIIMIQNRLTLSYRDR